MIKDKTKKKMQEKLFSKRFNIDGLERKEKERKKERETEMKVKDVTEKRDRR